MMGRRGAAESRFGGRHSENGCTGGEPVEEMLDFEADLEDEFICVGRKQPWSVESIARLVETITEEIDELLRVVGDRNSNSSESGSCAGLETQVRSWAGITPKALQIKLSTSGVLEEWNCLVVEALCQSRQDLMAVKQSLRDRESELADMDELRAQCRASNKNLILLENEIQMLEAQRFNDNLEREDEVNLLREELQKTKLIIAESQSNIAEEQMTVLALREQLQESEIELDSANSGWAAEQEFIDSCLGGGKLEGEEKALSIVEMGRMEKKLADVMLRLGENEQELGELLTDGGGDTDSAFLAKIKHLEEQLEEAKATELSLLSEKVELASQITAMKTRLAQAEYELELDNRLHVETLLRYEEEQGDLVASTRSGTGIAEAKLHEVEHLLAEKTKQLEIVKGSEDSMSASQTQVRALSSRVFTLESNLSITRQKAMDCESALKSQIYEDSRKHAALALRFSALQNNFKGLKMEVSESEHKLSRAQSEIDKLQVELGIAKDEVLKYEVRLQKTIRQAKEELDLEKRKHENTVLSQKQMEWHLCRQLEVTEAIEREKGKLHQVLEEFELENLALQREGEQMRSAYLQLSKRAGQRDG